MKHYCGVNFTCNYNEKTQRSIGSKKEKKAVFTDGFGFCYCGCCLFWGFVCLVFADWKKVSLEIHFHQDEM